MLLDKIMYALKKAMDEKNKAKSAKTNVDSITNSEAGIVAKPEISNRLPTGSNSNLVAFSGVIKNL